MKTLAHDRAFLRGQLPPAAVLALLCSCAAEAPPDKASERLVPRPPVLDQQQEVLETNDATGQLGTISLAGRVRTDGLFFQSLGTNGRSCASCHVASEGWTITPAGLRRRFEATRGTDPVFRTNDGSNSPAADVSTVTARRAAYSMLLNKGLIRVGMGIPAGADFELVAVDDPYRAATRDELSLFRRPLPSTNLTFLTAVMWDGRETFAGQTIHFDLDHQASDATIGHAMGPPLTPAQQEEIETFETGLFTAQTRDDAAGDLTTLGARGGPEALSVVPFTIGINDPLGPPGGFDPVAMSLFASWESAPGRGARAEARAAVARGQRIFNTKAINIDGVRGLNPDGPPISATCTTCHNSPDVGNHSVALALDLGLTDASRRTPDLPLYTLRHLSDGALFRTTDPGRAMVTGKWSDRGRFKGPILRGLSSRAPYFHNGSAATLEQVLEFYSSRFGVPFTAGEKSDLVAFLRTL